MYQPIVSLLKEHLEKSGTRQIVDLGSGGGGGLIWLNSELKKEIPDLKIVLTDFYPNLPAFQYTQRQAENFEYVETPVDAKNVPAALKGLRTLFLSFHHFKPAEAKQILQNAIDTRNSIAIFEAQERSVPSILAMLFSPLSVLFSTPFIRPFKFGRILFTYIIPVVPLFVLWDGVVSSLRTYSVKEMEDLVQELNEKEKFHWEINKVKSGPGVVLYLLGSPK